MQSNLARHLPRLSLLPAQNTLCISTPSLPRPAQMLFLYELVPFPTPPTIVFPCSLVVNLSLSLTPRIARGEFRCLFWHLEPTHSNQPSPSPHQLSPPKAPTGSRPHLCCRLPIPPPEEGSSRLVSSGTPLLQSSWTEPGSQRLQSVVGGWKTRRTALTLPLHQELSLAPLACWQPTGAELSLWIR